MKRPIEVIRIEHPSDGLGVWRSEDKYKDSKIDAHSEWIAICEKHNDETKFPTYNHDTELKRQIDLSTLEKYRFAFLNIQQLNTAFTETQLDEIISKLGFKVYLLNVTDYFRSPFQVVFQGYEFKRDISSLFILK